MLTTHHLSQSLLTEKEVAQFLNVSVKMLQKQRQQNIGIRYSKIGSLVRYSMSDVIAYIERSKANV